MVPQKKQARAKGQAVSPVEAGILQGLKEAVAFERGTLPNVRVTRRLVTARTATAPSVPHYTAAKVRQIRKSARLSQPVFAAALNVSPETVKAWEQGKTTPHGAALRLLQIAEQHPRVVWGVVQPIP